MSRRSTEAPSTQTNGESNSDLVNGETLNGLDQEPTVAVDSAPAAAKVSKKGKHTESSVEQELREQLERANLEKEALETQYQTLLDRLSEMRSKIGLKLQQDADELEQRETLITTLTAQNEDLQSTINSLSSELTSSNAESERVTKDLDTLRLTLQQQQQSSSLMLSAEVSSLTSESQSLRDQLREKEDLLERGKLEKEEWERILMEERMAAESLRGENRTIRRELDTERITRKRYEKEWVEEQTRANNLESVLAEFEAGQQSSISTIKETYTAQIDSLTQSLAEYKSRALNAEVELQEGKTSSDRVEHLEKLVKEKDVLLTKVRSEAVTLNEHLIQALRRLRKFSADPSGATASGGSPSYVDRRLVTNILLQFLTTPRADRKRFEMLSLLGGILGWGDEERERAGLQKSGSGGSPIGSTTPKLKGKTGDDDRGDETFSKMWVEFLLKEASQGSSSTSTSTSSPSPSHAHSPSLFSPSSYAPSAYAPSNYTPSAYTKSNYAASSTGAPSPTQSYTNLPPLPPLSNSPANGASGARSVSGAFRLPSLSRGKSNGEIGH